MVLLLCLAFVGQSVAASVMSYHMISMKVMKSQTLEQDMTTMNHSHHKMMTTSSEGNGDSEDECCAQGCNCFAGGCSSSANLLKQTDHQAIVDLAPKISSYTPQLPTQTASSLYRPPILS